MEGVGGRVSHCMLTAPRRQGRGEPRSADRKRAAGPGQPTRTAWPQACTLWHSGTLRMSRDLPETQDLQAWGGEGIGQEEAR